MTRNSVRATPTATATSSPKHKPLSAVIATTQNSIRPRRQKWTISEGLIRPSNGNDDHAAERRLGQIAEHTAEKQRTGDGRQRGDELGELRPRPGALVDRRLREAACRRHRPKEGACDARDAVGGQLLVVVDGRLAAAADGAGDRDGLQETHDGDGEGAGCERTDLVERRCDRGGQTRGHRSDQGDAMIVDRPPVRRNSHDQSLSPAMPLPSSLAPSTSNRTNMITALCCDMNCLIESSAPTARSPATT
jgi:hypothetical protein